MVGAAFRNIEVYRNIPENLVCNGVCERHAHSFKDCIDTWFSTPPKFTTVRANSLVTSVERVAAFINDFLTQEGVKQGRAAPEVFQHPFLADCLVVTPWPDADEEQVITHDQEVIVDNFCGAAVLRGADVFAPGVMGLLPNIQEGDLVSVYADSNGKCKRGLSIPFTENGKVFVGNGIMKMSRKFLFQKDLHPKGIAVEITEAVSGVPRVKIPQRLGLLQNLPSLVCGHVLSPQPGEKVIDLCAAPGHKTTHLAALMENNGILVALDKTPRKIEALKSFSQTMGASFIKAFVYDSTKAVSFSTGSDWSPPYDPETFDRVLLDAPCSALGQRPQLGSKITDKQISSYPKLQKTLFFTAVQLLKPGGTLVYSTCSLTIAENEEIVSWALDTFQHLKLVPAYPILGKQGSLKSSLSEIDCNKVQRFGPSTGPRPEDDTIGFFIAKFVKTPWE